MRLSPAFNKMLLAWVMMAVCIGTAGAQQPFPNRPIRVIVPYPTGGSVDPLARLVTEKMGEGFKQRLIVDNRPGGNTIIGSDALAKSKPDGYTLMVMSRTFIVTSLLFPTPFDIIKDFSEKLTNLGMDPFASGPDKLAAMIKSDIVSFGEIIKKAKIKVEP